MVRGRSSNVAVIFPSPNVGGHLENERLFVMITDVLAGRLRRWNRICPPRLEIH